MKATHGRENKDKALHNHKKYQLNKMVLIFCRNQP